MVTAFSYVQDSRNSPTRSLDLGTLEGGAVGDPYFIAGGLLLFPEKGIYMASEASKEGIYMASEASKGSSSTPFVYLPFIRRWMSCVRLPLRSSR